MAIFSSLCLFLPLAFPCLPKPENPIDSDKYRLVKHACDNEGEYSPLATVFLPLPAPCTASSTRLLTPEHS